MANAVKFKDNVKSSDMSFTSGGVDCRATLYLPDGVASPPAIVMVQGWGGTRHMLTLGFVAAFVDAGFAVVTFDYRGWGDSGGQPRHVINPWRQLQDIEALLAKLKTLDDIDPTKIILWGSSLGGGHVTEIAASHPELLGMIGQVPMLDGVAAVKSIPFSRILRFQVDGIIDLFRGKNPRYLKVVSEPGQYSTMDEDGAFKAIQRGAREIGKKYDNRVAARSVLTLIFYRPYRKIAKIRIPTLYIPATRDVVAPFVAKKVAAANNPLVQVEFIDSNHFKPYYDAPFKANVEKQLRFLRTIVPR